MVSVVLNSALLGTVLWGPELRMFYNDAYIPAMGERHGTALGQPITAVWGDVWDRLAPSFLPVMRSLSMSATFNIDTWRMKYRATS